MVVDFLSPYRPRRGKTVCILLFAVGRRFNRKIKCRFLEIFSISLGLIARVTIRLPAGAFDVGCEDRFYREKYGLIILLQDYAAYPEVPM